MGAIISRRKNIQLLVLGLDGAGKTSLISQHLNGTIKDIVPTVGFNVDKINDVGGQDSLRPLWKHYFSASDGIVFVIDSSDENNFSKAKLEIVKITTDAELANVLIIFVANKQDLPNAKSVDEITKILELDQISTHQWKIIGISSKTGDGLSHLFSTINDEFKKLKLKK